MYITLAWENSRNLAMLPLVSPPNDVWENECRNSILMMAHYPDLGSASDWLNQIYLAARPMRSTTQILVVTCHQYGISALFSQTSFGAEASGSVAECQLFSQPNITSTYFGALYLIVIIKEFFLDQMNAWSTSQVERTQKMIIPKIMLTCHSSYSFCSTALIKQ